VAWPWARVPWPWGVDFPVLSPVCFPSIFLSFYQIHKTRPQMSIQDVVVPGIRRRKMPWLGRIFF
jgi:hypothetical protein